MATIENENDEQYLFVLHIFYYVMAGLDALYCLILLLQLYMVQSFSRSIDAQVYRDLTSDTPDMPADISSKLQSLPWSSSFDFFSGLVIVMLVFAVFLAIGEIIAAASLRARKNYTFCMVMAAINCLFVPIGTILGVATIFVLVRPSVKRMF